MKLSRKLVLASTVAILLLATAWKILLLRWQVVPFNADEAVVALMARHILAGQRPVFFYGQAYMGSLDAFLVAAGFWLLGQQVWVVRLTQALLYLGTIITTILLGKVALGSTKTGLLAGLLLAIPAVNVTLYTTASLGGYGEALLIGNLILLVGFGLLSSLGGIPSKPDSSSFAHIPGGLYSLPYASYLFAWLALGFLMGLGLWANALTLVYSFPVAVALGLAWLRGSKASRRSWLPLLVGLSGFLAGSAPWWLYAAHHGLGQLVQELTGSAVAVESGPWLLRSLRHLLSFVLLGGTAAIGARPPWEVRWLALPLLPLAVAFWLGVVLYFFNRALRPNRNRAAYRLLLGVILTLAAGFVLTSFGVDPSGRYLLPLAVPLALAAAEMVQKSARRSVIQLGLLGVVLAFNLWGVWQCALSNPPGITTQFDLQTALDHAYDSRLIAFLDQTGERYGYSTYWVSYPLAFQSGERLIYVPRLPYHADLRYTPRDDRYPPYSSLVAQAEKVAYISARNPALDERLRAYFTAQAVTWSEQVIGDYRVFYRLSRPVRPDGIDWDQPDG